MTLDFRLKVDTWKDIINTNANVLPTAGVTGTAITINIIEFMIQLQGTISGPHSAHPVSSDHNPDLRDLEEFALLANREGLANKVILTLSLPDRDVVYTGIVKQLSLEEGGGLPVQSFTLLFQALWTVSKPPWRGWATAP